MRDDVITVACHLLIAGYAPHAVLVVLLRVKYRLWLKKVFPLRMFVANCDAQRSLVWPSARGQLRSVACSFADVASNLSQLTRSVTPATEPFEACSHNPAHS